MIIDGEVKRCHIKNLIPKKIFFFFINRLNVTRNRLTTISRDSFAWDRLLTISRDTFARRRLTTIPREALYAVSFTDAIASKSRFSFFLCVCRLQPRWSAL